MNALRLKTHHFDTKLSYQMPMLRQIKWWLQSGPIKKKRVFPVTTLFFWKFCFSLRTSYKELICCTNNPNAHICTFCKRWSSIWRCFFSVSILKEKKYIITSYVVREAQIGSQSDHKEMPRILWFKEQWKIHLFYEL